MKVKRSLLRSQASAPNYGKCSDWPLVSPLKPLLRLRNQLRKRKQLNRVKSTKLTREMSRNCHSQKFQLTRRHPNYNKFPETGLTKLRPEPKKRVALTKLLQQRSLASP